MGGGKSFYYVLTFALGVLQIETGGGGQMIEADVSF